MCPQGWGPGLTDLQGPLWFASPRCSGRSSAGMPSEEGRAGDSAPGLASSGPGAGGPVCPPGSAPWCLPAFLPGPALGLYLPGLFGFLYSARSKVNMEQYRGNPLCTLNRKADRLPKHHM